MNNANNNEERMAKMTFGFVYILCIWQKLRKKAEQKKNYIKSLSG